MKLNKQTTMIVIAMILGLVVGSICHSMVTEAATAKDISGYFSMLTDIFLRLIKTIIAPLIFSTLVAGMAGMADGRTAGRIGSKAIGWFLGASFTSLFIGLVFANLLQPGAALNVPLPDANAATHLNTTALNLKDFVTHLFPRNIVEAMATNEILQILIFAVMFGLALGQLRSEGAHHLAQAIEEMVPAMLKVTSYVMRVFAPVGIFGAVASVVTVQGLGVLLVYGKLAGCFYLTLLALWTVMIGVAYLVLGREVFRLIGLLRAPLLLGFSTATSESAYPQVMEALETFGIKERVVGFVLPLGYSFNLDGSMIYTTFAALFISQAYNVHLDLGQQILMLLVLMVSTKGIAGVPRASLVVVAAVLPMFHLPEAGLLLIMGIDHFLDMGRTVTNVLGNGIATAVVAKWERGFEEPGEAALAAAEVAPGIAE